MNSYGWQLASWAAGFEDRRPFYLAVIDGENRLGFVNSHFFLQFQQSEDREEETSLHNLVDECDRLRFTHAFDTCLLEEKDLQLQVRMLGRNPAWVKWELRFLDAVGEGPGRIFCLGFEMSNEEVAKAGNQQAGGRKDSDTTINDCNTCVAAQKRQQFKKLREAAVLAEHQERERIGRELHDNVNQILTSAQLYLSCLNPESTEFDKLKSKTSEILTMAIDEIRALSHNIVAPDLREKGLIESVESLVEDIKFARGFDLSFNWSDLLTIETQDEDLKLTVYRIVQEQIHNIVKYSKATKVHIQLQGANQQLRLQITDNGVGFDPDRVHKGLGLEGIHRRAKLFKGRAQFNTKPGQGCTLFVTIPLELRRIM